MIQVLRNFLCFCFFMLVTATTLALPEDSSKNMHIDADSTLFNYKTGFNTYEGNVNVLQGATHLTADRVTTQNNDHHKISEAIAYGKDKLAHYWTVPQKGDPLFHAQAKIIKFYPLTSLVVLQGEVQVTQGNNSFNGSEIIYNIKDQTVTSPANKKGRATIIIDPTKLTT
jgi:lipopolysaccharide export system protein LptA